jgi:hypothetical protein
LGGPRVPRDPHSRKKAPPGGASGIDRRPDGNGPPRDQHLLGGPIGIAAGGSIGALVSKLRNSGFKNDQLEQLGKSLQPNTSAVVIEIAGDAIETAKEVLEPLGAEDFVAGTPSRLAAP